jgi:hypothetical protein
MTMTKQNLLQDLPPMLVLHIKRFHYDPEMGTQKLRRRITYGPYLRIQPSRYYYHCYNNNLIFNYNRYGGIISSR